MPDVNQTLSVSIAAVLHCRDLYSFLGHLPEEYSIVAATETEVEQRRGKLLDITLASEQKAVYAV